MRSKFIHNSLDENWSSLDIKRSSIKPTSLFISTPNVEILDQSTGSGPGFLRSWIHKIKAKV